MFKSPYQILLAGLLALLVMTAALWGLRLYIRGYHRPVQNRIPHGSFWPTHEGRPAGWEVLAGDPRIQYERSEAHVPLQFARLGPGAALRTEIALLPGWRLLHLALWHRSPGTGSLVATGELLGPDGPLETGQVVARPRSDGQWHRAEGLWTRPAAAERLVLTVRNQSSTETWDLAELRLVPSYVFQEGRKMPTF